MSTHTRITDEEMRYFQFKARQRFLIQKEDHEWNEFCKLNQCTCCSCQPAVISNPHKNVGIQVSAKTPLRFNRNTNIKTIQDKELPESLNEINSRLEKISLTLSEIKQIPPKDNVPKAETLLSNDQYTGSDSALNLLDEQRKSMIKKSLMSSLQKLHSYAMQRSTRPLSSPYIKRKNNSFFLPHDLQKQRLIARNAYLTSLINKPNVRSKKIVPDLNTKKNTANEKSVKKQPQTTGPKLRKKKSISTTKPKEQETLIESEKLNAANDETIEKVVDGIVDDLVGEEILGLNRIKQLKIERKCNSITNEENNNTQIKAAKSSQFPHHPETSTQIKKIPFFNLNLENSKSFIKSASCSLNNLERLDVDIRNHVKENQLQTDGHVPDSQEPQMKSSTKTDSKQPSTHYQTLYVDPNMAKNVIKQRKLYCQYLQKVDRTRTHNFDPLALSNMVTESLLDDCIADVCEELGNVQTSLITDIINQEFTPTL